MPRSIAVYVTSHGYGHMNRVVAVLNAIPPEIPIVVTSGADLFANWRERLIRPAALRPGVWDAGAHNPPGDSQRTDGPGTLAAARALDARARGELPGEVDFLRGLQPAAVIADAPYLPLVAARSAGIPAYLLANFTWSDIYAPHAARLTVEDRAFVSRVRADERAATLLLRAWPAMAMPHLPRRLDVGLVVTRGVDRSEELKERLRLPGSTRFVYFYLGRYGQSGVEWRRIAPLAERGVHFLALHPPGAPGDAEPPPELPNYHVLNAREWTGADLAATASAVYAKAGYGTVSESIAARTPLVYPPRSGFAEHRALDRALKGWGPAFSVPRRAFQAFGPTAVRALERALAAKAAAPPAPVSIDGAREVAALLESLAR